jgi:hypothetical protein
MSNEEIFSVWAPDNAPWSRWAKPVLFSFLKSEESSGEIILPEVDLSWVPAADAKTLVVIDLPGANGLVLGLGLARRGYRPVPVYNAVPFGSDSLKPEEPQAAAVDMLPILSALAAGAEILRTINLQANAPPAFLLDANRAGTKPPEPGQFDNRSVSFTTDFPSATFLLSSGITDAVLVMENVSTARSDLAHTLLKWQEGGIQIWSKRLDLPAGPARITIDRPSYFRSMFQRALISFGLRRSDMGGFGGWLQDAEGHGGGG